MDDEKALVQGRIRALCLILGVEADEKHLTETSNLNIRGPQSLLPPNDRPSDQYNASYKPRASRLRGPRVRDITQGFSKAASGMTSGCTSISNRYAEAARSFENRRTCQR